MTQRLQTRQAKALNHKIIRNIFVRGTPPVSGCNEALFLLALTAACLTCHCLWPHFCSDLEFRRCYQVFSVGLSRVGRSRVLCSSLGSPRVVGMADLELTLGSVALKHRAPRVSVVETNPKWVHFAPGGCSHAPGDLHTTSLMF